MAEAVSKRVRGYMRKEVTEVEKKVNEDMDDLPHDESMKLSIRLDQLKDDLKNANDSMMKELVEDEKLTENEIQSEYKSCAAYDLKIRFCIRKLEESMKINSKPENENSDSNRSPLKLPPIPLPEYHHTEGEDMHKFFVEFENIINRYKLNPYEKFVYLQRQLFNEPKTIIRSLKSSKHTYDEAKKLLEEAFCSQDTQRFKAIQELSAMKLSTDGEPYEYVAKMRQISESFETLKIDSNHILQYFFWFGMNEALQKQFIYITNENKPNLDQLNTHIFSAVDRYISLSKSAKSEKTTRAYAAAVEKHDQKQK